MLKLPRFLRMSLRKLPRFLLMPLFHLLSRGGARMLPFHLLPFLVLPLLKLSLLSLLPGHQLAPLLFVAVVHSRAFSGRLGASPRRRRIARMCPAVHPRRRCSTPRFRCMH
ncbi:MAG: hypothetical protein WBL75_12755, partial [Candidatus Acidiferrum sp.]